MSKLSPAARILPTLCVVLLLAMTVGCATVRLSPVVTPALEPFMAEAETIAVEPFVVTVEPTPINIVQLSPEAESQDISSKLVQNTVRVLVRSPRVLEEYAIRQSDLPRIVQESMIGVLTSTEEFNVLLWSDMRPYEVSSFSKDPESPVSLPAPGYSVEALPRRGAGTDADLVIGGHISFEARVARVTRRMADPVSGQDIRVSYEPDTYLLILDIAELRVEVRSGPSGEVLRSYDEPPYKLVIPADVTEAAAVLPATDEAAVLSYLDTDRFRESLGEALENYLVRFIPSLRDHVIHEAVRVE